MNNGELLKKVLWAALPFLVLASGCSAKTALPSSSAHIPACGWTESSEEGDDPVEKDTAEKDTAGKLSAQEAWERMSSEDDVVVLDVRTPEEYAAGHIPGRMLIPDAELVEKAEEFLPDKDAEILVYCRSGRRSAASAELLAERGYLSVWDFGGILDWPYEIEKGE